MTAEVANVTRPPKMGSLEEPWTSFVNVRRCAAEAPVTAMPQSAATKNAMTIEARTPGRDPFGMRTILLGLPRDEE
jgi:hypothetical protein